MMASTNDPLYLGFDLSTQQLKAIVVNSDLKTVAEAKVDFDADFAHRYNTTKGVLTNPPLGEVFTPIALWLESIDLVLARLRSALFASSPSLSLSRIRAIGGSGQQHGSIFWNANAEPLLRNLAARPEIPLAEQLGEAFAWPFSPNWQDHSTQRECDAFDAALGGRDKLAEATGSGAHHRFTGEQIMRMRRIRPEVYANTVRISLVSSWLASVLIGGFAPIDIGDVCGMNLWDIPNFRYHESLLALAAGGNAGDGDAANDLRDKLGPPAMDGGRAVGIVSAYFVQRYGFRPDCQVVPFTGDNLATILALPLRPLDAIVSLGTSTTFLMNTPNYKPHESYHFFNHPTTPGNYMFMLCYKNGGLAREKVRDSLTDDSNNKGKDPWNAFNSAILASPPLGRHLDEDRAKIGLYFPLRETVPNIRAGTWRFTCDPSGLHLQPSTWDKSHDPRAIVESQALSMRLRSRSLVHSPREGLPAQPRRIYLVGGGALNPAIARVVGEVLGGADGVYRLDVGGNACALGGAYKALWGMERRRGETFDELLGGRWREEGSVERVDGGYREDVYPQYGGVLRGFEEMERMLLEEEAKREEP